MGPTPAVLEVLSMPTLNDLGDNYCHQSNHRSHALFNYLPPDFTLHLSTAYLQLQKEWRVKEIKK